MQSTWLAMGLLLAGACASGAGGGDTPGPDEGPGADVAIAPDAVQEAGSEAACTSDCPPAPLEVGTAEGPVRGTAVEVPLVEGRAPVSVRSFKGLPYAAPPVGELRFRPPRPAPVRQDTLEAAAFGPACLQARTLMSEARSFAEDCLTLNVWAPGVATGQPAPVLVFVHGGGYVMGGAESRVFDGATLAAAHGLVVVTLNYRLGPFGFLAHPALTAEDPAHPASGNWGLEDQRAALAWVHDNIAAFGGDPANVTLMGQSAGGMSVVLQAVSPPAAGLFRRVIVESAFAYENLADLATGEAQGRELAEALGCAAADRAAAAACLRGAPGDQVLAALPLKPGIFFGEGAAWGPWVDGLTVPAQPFARVAAGAAGGVEVVLGSNGDEGSLLRFLSFPGGVKEEEYAPFVHEVFGALADTVLERYPLAAFATPLEAMDAVLGDFVFVCPSRRTARALRDAGSAVLLYRFLHEPGFLPLPGAGSYHTAELPFVFRSPPGSKPFTAGQEALATAMAGAWAAFAAGGSAVLQATWEPMPTDADGHAVWDLEARPGRSSDYASAACDFWDTLPARP